MGPFDVQEGLYDNATADHALREAEENRKRIERIEKAMGIGPPPPPPPPQPLHVRLERHLKAAYCDAFEDAVAKGR